MQAERWILAGLLTAFGMLAALAAVALWPHAPSAVAAQFFPAAFLERSAAYSRGAYLSFALRTAVQLGLLAWIAFSGLAERWGERALRLCGGRPVLAAVLFAVGLALLLSLVDAPFAYWRGFYWEHRFGLSTQPAAAWWADQAKGWAIGAALQAVVFAALFFLIVRLPHAWWVPASALLAAGLWLLTLLSPVVIDPLFYRFRPLPPSPLKTTLLDMASRAGVPARDVWVADASRRTQRVNAYVTGSGPTRRIVLYDTLLQKYDDAQVELVVAHEIGHLAEAHIAKGVALGAAGGVLGLWLLARFLRGLWERGILSPLPHPAAVAWILLLSSLGTLSTMPLQNAISRQFERQADAISFRLAPHPEAAVSLERRLALSNLADVDPQPYVEWLLFTHPPQLERLLAAEAAARRAGGAKSK